MSKKELKNNSGFTLAEMLVSVAVIVIVSAMSLVSFRSTNNNASSSMAAQKLASDIRMVQGWALSLKDFDNVTDAGSWGLYFGKNKDYYSFWIDVDGNHLCKTNCVASPGERQGDYIQVLNHLNITDIRLFNGVVSNSVSMGQISFSPPEPVITICGVNSASCGKDKIEIELDNGANIVTINKYGMVDVD